MIDRDATTLHIVVTDHIHSRDGDVVSCDSHGGDFAGNLPEHRLREAMGDENQSFDLELLESVNLRSFQSGVISPADQHGGEPVLSDLCLNTIEDLGENRVVEIEHKDTEGATFFGRQTSGGGIGSIPQLLSGAFDTLPAGVTDFV
jgi:hypothetical protein